AAIANADGPCPWAGGAGSCDAGAACLRALCCWPCRAGGAAMNTQHGAARPQKGRDQFDVVIVGAGIAGSALACAPADTRLRVALIEVQPLATAMPQPAAGVGGFDARVSALTVASQQLLAQLGAWQAIAAQRVCGYREMQVWDADGTGSIHFDCADIH